MKHKMTSILQNIVVFSLIKSIENFKRKNKISVKNVNNHVLHFLSQCNDQIFNTDILLFES